METNREVVYRKIPMTDFMYEVSSDGRIVRNVKSKRQLRQYKDQHDYWYVQIKIKGETKIKKVHQLVADCWLGPANGLQVDHIDRNKCNNHYSNLRYVTNQVNSLNKDFTNYKIANQERLGQDVQVDGKQFQSFTEAAKYLADIHNKNFNTARKYFKMRRSYIWGHTITYCRDCIL